MKPIATTLSEGLHTLSRLPFIRFHRVLSYASVFMPAVHGSITR